MTTICLNMIVKNESHIINETLSKLCTQITFSYWVICDTGSTDNTCSIITDFFKQKNINGELYNDEWTDFSTNRNLALKKAFKKTDYLFIFDADDSIHGTITIPTNLVFDGYYFKMGSIETQYLRLLLLNNHKKFEYKSILHEYIECQEDAKITIIEGDYYIESGRTGSRNKNPNKYLDDALLLEKAYTESKIINDSIYTRYAFYCANSYRDCGQIENAIKWYKLVLTHPNQWNQESYVSCLQLYYLYRSLNSCETGFFYLIESIKYDSHRIECIYQLIYNYYYIKKNNKMAYHYYLLINDFYENTFLSMNMIDKLFIEHDKYNFYLPYYMIAVSENINNKTRIKMIEIILLKKYKIINRDFIRTLLHNLLLFIETAIVEIKDFINLLQVYLSFLSTIHIYLDLNEDSWLTQYHKYKIKFPTIPLIKYTYQPDCHNSKNILIYTGLIDTEWNMTTSKNKAIGGSETVVCQLLKYFPSDYTIYVSGSVIEETIDNIHFIHINTLSNFVSTLKFHTVLVSRFVDFYELFPQTEFYQSFIWAHDTTLISNHLNVSSILTKWSNKITGCICQTPWHMNTFIKMYPSLTNKLYHINNGIDIKKFNFRTNKIENQFIYSSRPERGLEKLLKLWPDILVSLPTATLYICSYVPFDNEHFKKLESIIKQFNNIKYVGCLDKTQLYELMKSSMYWLYPTNYCETSCITAMEMLMSEVICLYYPIAGLVDTIGNYGIQIQECNEIKTICNLTNNQITTLQENGKKYALSCSWENRWIEWNKLLFNNLVTKNWCFYYQIFNILCIKEYIEQIKSEFEIIICNDINELKKLHPCKITFVLNNYLDVTNCIPTSTIVKDTDFKNVEFSYLQLEPLNIDKRLQPILQTLTYTDKIYDYSKSNIEILNKNGFTNCEYLPYNVTETEKQHLIQLKKNRICEYDFGIIHYTTTFLDMTHRRYKVCDFLLKKGFKVNIISGFGEKRDVEVAQCKYLLNIHGQINNDSNVSENECTNIFEHIRCDRYLEAGYQILSQDSYLLDPIYIKKYKQNLTIIKYDDFFNLNIKKNWCFYYTLFHIIIIKEYIEQIKSEFNIIICNDINELKNLHPCKITFILDNHLNPTNCIPTSTILKDTNFKNVEFSYLQLEPLTMTKRLSPILQTLTYTDKIYDYSKSNIEILNKNGYTNCEYLPYNVTETEKQDLIQLKKNQICEYDFGIIHCNTDISTLLYKRFKVCNFLIKQGYKVNIIAGFGEKRDVEVAKCKYLLNIHSHIYESNTELNTETESNIFEHIRCDRYLEAGYQILSQDSYLLDPIYIEKYKQNLTIIKYDDFFNLNILQLFIHKVHF